MGNRSGQQESDPDILFIFIGLAMKLGCAMVIVTPFLLVLWAGFRYFRPNRPDAPKVAIQGRSTPAPSPSADRFEAFTDYSPEESRLIVNSVSQSLRAFNRGNGREFFSWFSGTVSPSAEKAFENCYPSSLRNQIGVIDYFFLFPGKKPFALIEENEANVRMGMPRRFRRGKIELVLHGSNSCAVDSISLLDLGDGWKPSQQLIEHLGPLPNHSVSDEFRL